MKVTVLNIIIAVNIALLLAIFVAGYGLHSLSGYDNMSLLLAPFALSLLNLVLGLVCVVVLLVLNLVNKAWRDVADKMMQGFMIAFGLTFAIAIPACFAGLGMR